MCFELTDAFLFGGHQEFGYRSEKVPQWIKIWRKTFKEGLMEMVIDWNDAKRVANGRST